jgi:hypothetical protein
LRTIAIVYEIMPFEYKTQSIIDFNAGPILPSLADRSDGLIGSGDVPIETVETHSAGQTGADPVAFDWVYMEF